MELGSVVLQCSHYCIPSHKLISSSLPRITDYNTNEFPLQRIAARRVRVGSVQQVPDVLGHVTVEARSQRVGGCEGLSGTSVR